MEDTQVRTLQDLLLRAAKERPQKVWLREKAGKDIAEKSFGDFLDDSRRVSAFLRTQGDGPIHAGLVGSASIAYLTCLFGSFIDGNMAVPIDPQLSRKSGTGRYTGCPAGR